MSEAASRRATYQDVLDAPGHQVAELFDGQLHLQPRPSARHARSATTIAGQLEGPFNRGQAGPGGWIILHEPELHLAAEIVVPDVAGWRRSTLPELPDSAFFSVRPDWVAEVLSPATQRTDRTLKVPLYRTQGVSHVWLVDPLAQTVEVYRLHAEGYILVGTHGGEGLLSIEPFEAIEFDVGALWQR
jgi:Uma2 family endonuclease